MEAIKGVIFDRGPTKLGSHEAHTYLVGLILVTDKPITNLTPLGNIIMGASQITQGISEALDHLDKYKPPFILGDLSDAVLSLPDMDPRRLEKVNGT